MPWVYWDEISMPKALGGWGLKNIFHFSKALAAKVGWCLISTNILWTTVVIEKYIKPYNLIEWMRLPSWNSWNSSVMCKELLKYFEIFRNGLAWRVGDGKSIQVGMDPWLGSGINDILPVDLCTFLAEAGFRTLHQIWNPDTNTIWQQGWLPAVHLNLLGEHLDR